MDISKGEDLEDNTELAGRIEHFSHHHEIIQYDCDDDRSITWVHLLEKPIFDFFIYGASLFCNVCDEAVIGPYYSCNQCPRGNSFIIHKSCTELPVQMHHHPLHADHPLTFIRNARNYTCNLCREKFYGPTLATFAYRCSKSGCDFIDLKCASTSRKITENHFSDHPHQFSLYKKPKLKFKCEACGVEGRYSAYICSICKLWVHKNCTSLPGHLKTRVHPHLLMLRWSLEGIIKIHQEVCKLCYENMYGSGCFYYCEPCHYIAHNRCAVTVDIDDLDDDEMIEEASNANHPINPDVLAQQITNEDLHEQIEHFSHQHLLTLISGHHDVIKYDGDDNSTLNCDGCMRPISPTDAFYRCMQQQQEEQPNCHFFLHTNCARLPTKMRHRFHPQSHFSQKRLLLMVCLSVTYATLLAKVSSTVVNNVLSTLTFNANFFRTRLNMRLTTIASS